MASNTKWWLARFGIAVGVLVAAVLIVVGDRLFLSYAESGSEQEDLSLETQWNKSISRLGIEPVYPPQEDIAVGDLFAVAVSDDERDSANVSKRVGPSSTFLSRAIKLAHVPVQNEIIEEYAQLPIFTSEPIPAPPTTNAATAVPQTPKQIASSHIFGQGDWQLVRPRAAFPGLTISFAGNATAGLSGGERGWFGHSVSRGTVEKLELRFVETYGLTSIAAQKALDNFCGTNKDTCSEVTARARLKAVPGLGDRVLDRIRNPNSGEDFYVLGIKIFMINRVYMARQILEQWSIRDAEGISGRVSLPGSTAARTDSKGQSAPAAGSADGSANSQTVSNVAVERRLDDLESKLTAISGGGIVAYSSENGLEGLLNETFTRPIAIGFRSVEYHPTNP
jgi:hypothetical protein